MAQPVTISSLFSGGLMTNYYCTSRCRHCLYYCSPQWAKVYIDPQTTKAVLTTLRRMDCSSVHIGGGEPFLDPEGLKMVLTTFREMNMGLDYVETNCSWYKDHTSAVALLRELKEERMGTILVSISPFHNEYIPFRKTMGVIAAAREAGVGVFPWVDGFIADLGQFDHDTTHTLEEFERHFGNGYINNIPKRYWVTFRGRALDTYAPYMTGRSAAEILEENRGPCRELFDTSHFHIDMCGDFIPGLCTGLALSHTDLGQPISRKKYPYLYALMTGGIEALLSLAETGHRYIPANSYVSKCHLCYQIRRFLVVDRKVDSPDLQPVQYYEVA